LKCPICFSDSEEIIHAVPLVHPTKLCLCGMCNDKVTFNIKTKSYNDYISGHNKKRLIPTKLIDNGKGYLKTKNKH
jgi:hypothetical protein